MKKKKGAKIMIAGRKQIPYPTGRETLKKATAIADIFEQIAGLGQKDLAAHVANLLEKHYSIEWRQDAYLFARPKTQNTIPVLLVAHLDVASETVNRHGARFLRVGNSFFSQDLVLGADDRAGVASILHEVLENQEFRGKPYVLFTYDEEIGGVGAKEAAQDLGREIGKLINFMVEIDRRGWGHAVFYDCDAPVLEEYIKKKGFGIGVGSYTDIATLMPASGKAGLNLAAGYFEPHSKEEKFFVDALMPSIYLLEDMLRDAGQIGPVPYREKYRPQPALYTQPYVYGSGAGTTLGGDSKAIKVKESVVIYRANGTCRQCGAKTNLALRNLSNYCVESICETCLNGHKPDAVGLSYYKYDGRENGKCQICGRTEKLFRFKRGSGSQGSVCKYCLQYISGLILTSEPVRAINTTWDWGTCSACGHFAPTKGGICPFCEEKLPTSTARCSRCLSVRTCAIIGQSAFCHVCYSFEHEYIIEVAQRAHRCTKCQKPSQYLVISAVIAGRKTIKSASLIDLCHDCAENKIDGHARYLDITEVLPPKKIEYVLNYENETRCPECNKSFKRYLRDTAGYTYCPHCLIMESKLVA